MGMTRNEALTTLAEGKAALDALIAQLDDTQFERPATIGGGDWSVRDLVAHLAWWEEIAQQAVDDWRAGRVPWVEAVFRDGTVDDVNAGNDARTRGQSSAEVRERAARAHAAIVATISEMSDDEWAEKAFYDADKRKRFGMLLAAIVGAPKRGFGHAFAHLPDLEEYVKTLAH